MHVVANNNRQDSVRVMAYHLESATTLQWADDEETFAEMMRRAHYRGRVLKVAIESGDELFIKLASIKQAARRQGTNKHKCFPMGVV